MPAKVCPRCGMQYANLKSATCPQCFAKLEVVDDAMAQEMARARALIEGTPEFQQAKAADDERFREQSFGACLGVFGITLVTLIFSVALLVVTYNRHHHQFHKAPAAQISALRPGTLDILTVLPLADAPFDEVLPSKIGGYQRIKRDQDTVLPGTLTHIGHARYQLPGPGGGIIDLFAISAIRPTSEQNEFRLGISLYAQLGVERARPLEIFVTEQWRYAAVGAANTADSQAIDLFRQAMAAQFRT